MGNFFSRVGVACIPEIPLRMVNTQVYNQTFPFPSRLTLSIKIDVLLPESKGSARSVLPVGLYWRVSAGQSVETCAERGRSELGIIHLSRGNIVSRECFRWGTFDGLFASTTLGNHPKIAVLEYPAYYVVLVDKRNNLHRSATCFGAAQHRIWMSRPVDNLAVLRL